MIVYLSLELSFLKQIYIIHNIDKMSFIKTGIKDELIKKLKIEAMMLSIIYNNFFSSLEIPSLHPCINEEE